MSLGFRKKSEKVLNLEEFIRFYYIEVDGGIRFLECEFFIGYE